MTDDILRDELRRYREMLGEIRQRVGDPVRIPFWRRWRLVPKPPQWMDRRDDLSVNFRGASILLREGEVVWGALVQANSLLFQPGPDDHPATVVYSFQREWADGWIPLRNLAQRLYRLKEEHATVADAACRKYGEMLADEYDRALGTPVPKSLMKGRQAISTSIVFSRKHLPDGYLSSPCFPLLAHPQQKAVMLLPARYWPNDLLASWQR